jgi:hypothetical protein
LAISGQFTTEITAQLRLSDKEVDLNSPADYYLAQVLQLVFSDDLPLK